MPWRLQSEPTVVEKICGGLSYFTFGIVGMVYMLLFSKAGTQSQLFRFHFFQAILLSILAMLIGWGAKPLLDIVMAILHAVSPHLVTPFAGAVVWIAEILSKTFDNIFFIFN